MFGYRRIWSGDALDTRGSFDKADRRHTAPAGSLNQQVQRVDEYSNFADRSTEGQVQSEAEVREGEEGKGAR